VSGLASPELVRLLDGLGVELLVVGEMVEMRLLGVLAGVELVINWPLSFGKSFAWTHSKKALGTW